MEGERLPVGFDVFCLPGLPCSPPRSSCLRSSPLSPSVTINPAALSFFFSFSKVILNYSLAISRSGSASTVYTYGSDPSAWYLRRPCLRCSKCSAALNRFCEVAFETGEWHCVICSHTNSNRAELSDGNIHSYPELAHKVVEYIEPHAVVPAFPPSSNLSVVLMLFFIPLLFLTSSRLPLLSLWRVAVDQSWDARGIFSVPR